LLAEPLAGEGAFTHAGGVGLHHADDLLYMGAGKTGTHRSVSGNGVGRGSIGVDTVVQIPERTQLGLKEDIFTLGLSLTEEGAGVTDKGLDLLAVIGHPGPEVIHGVGLCAID